MTFATRILIIAVTLFLSPPVSRGGAPPAESPRSQSSGNEPANKSRPWLAEFPPREIYVGSRLYQGLNSKRADKLLREDPFAVETVKALVGAYREDQAFGAARQIFDKFPERIAPVLDALSRSIPGMGAVPGRNERAQAVLDHARARMAGLDTPARAEAAYALLKAESSLLWGVERSRDWYTVTLRKIAEEYRDTPTALEIQARLIDQAFYDDRTQSVARHEELLAFARAHLGTTAGAHALYSAAAHVASNGDMLNMAPRGGGGDPTDRFLRLLALVSELQGGRYPKCEWTTGEADRLVVGFSVYKATYAPENLDKLLAAYSSFAAAHWSVDEVYYGSNGIGYLLTSKVADLYKANGEGIAGFERFLIDLEAKVPDRFALQFLRAQYYLTTMASEPPAGKAAWLEKARQVLAAMETSADAFYRRKALATLAELSFQHREFVAARDLFAKYLRLYPDSPYGWVAAIRIGQCEQLTGNWAAALAAYQRVPAGGEAAPVPRVLADVLAGRAHEALDDHEKALAQFRKAAAAWDPAFGQDYEVGGPPETRRVALPFDANPEFRVVRLALQSRVTELERTTAAPGAGPLERARWLLGAGRWPEAARYAAEVVARYPASANVAEARYLGHRAVLEEALEKADVEKPGTDTPAAVVLLERLSKEPFDFAVCVADVARAYLASGAGASAQGELLLLQALSKWREQQSSIRTPKPLGALEQDVASIRSLVFRPNGDSIYAGTRWNGFAWPAQPTPFVVVAPEVTVKSADGQAMRLSFVQPFPHLDNALFFDEGQIALLNTLMTRLGGTKAREGQIFFDKGYMETPNQPLGPSLSVMTFLRKGFAVMPGHWGGWLFATFPTISELLFLDEARTRALVRVRVGYAGGDVMLEKQGGVWKATKLTQTWVE